MPAPCERSAATANAPDVNRLDGALLWLPGFRDSSPDVRGVSDENATVVSLDNNVAVPLLYAALAKRAETALYMDCLQGQGGALVPHNVCRYRRPLSTRLGPEDVPVPERPGRFKGIWRQEESQVQLQPPPAPAEAVSGDAPPLGTGSTGELADIEFGPDAGFFTR